MKIKEVIVAGVAALGITSALGYIDPVIAQGIDDISPLNIKEFKIEHKNIKHVENKEITEMDGYGFTKAHTPIHFHDKIIKINGNKENNLSQEKIVNLVIEGEGKKLVIKDDKKTYSIILNNEDATKVIENFAVDYKNSLNNKENIFYNENLEQTQSDNFILAENKNQVIKVKGIEIKVGELFDEKHPIQNEYEINGVKVTKNEIIKALKEKIGENNLKGIFKITNKMRL